MQNPEIAVVSPLKAPLTPRGKILSTSPKRGGTTTQNQNDQQQQEQIIAAILEAFEAVKLDDETTLYKCLTKSSSASSSSKQIQNINASSGTKAGVGVVVDCNSVEPGNPKKTTLLHWASYLGSIGCFEMLLQSPGINVNVTETDGKTPMHYCAFQGHYEMIEALANQNAYLDAPDELGQTPCHLARINGKEDVAEMFPNYQQVLDSSLAQEVQADTSFVPGGNESVEEGILPDGDGGDGTTTTTSPQQQHNTNDLLDAVYYDHKNQENQQQQQKQTAVAAADNFASPASSHNHSPHLLPRQRSVTSHVSSGNDSRSNSLQQQQQQNTENINTEDDKNTNTNNNVIEPIRWQQQQPNFGNNPDAILKNSGVDITLSPFVPRNSSSSASPNQPKQQQKQKQDPSLREDSEEMRQLAADEEALNTLERELEFEESAQRVAQAQCSWLERIQIIARQHQLLTDEQFSQRLWEMVQAIESSLLDGGTELEEKGKAQIRAITETVERQVLEKRADSSEIPLVMLRWGGRGTTTATSAKSQSVDSQQQQQQQQYHSPIPSSSMHGRDNSQNNQYNNNTNNSSFNNILSPFTPQQESARTTTNTQHNNYVMNHMKHSDRNAVPISSHSGGKNIVGSFENQRRNQQFTESSGLRSSRLLIKPVTLSASSRTTSSTSASENNVAVSKNLLSSTQSPEPRQGEVPRPVPFSRT